MSDHGYMCSRRVYYTDEHPTTPPASERTPGVVLQSKDDGPGSRGNDSTGP